MKCNVWIKVRNEWQLSAESVIISRTQFEELSATNDLKGSLVKVREAVSLSEEVE